MSSNSETLLNLQKIHESELLKPDLSGEQVMAFGDFRLPKIFGRKPPATAGHSNSVMAPELQRLDLYRPGLGAQAIAYVSSGENVSVIDAIAASVARVPIHSAPYHRDHTAKAAAEKETNLGLVTGKITGQEVARLMAVRIVSQVYRPPYRPGATPAGKLPTLALFAAVNAGLHFSMVNYSIPWETVISVRQLSYLVQCCEGDMADLFGFLLGQDSRRFLIRGSWQGSNECAELIRTDAAAFAQALKAVEHQYRLSSIQLVEHHGCQSLPEVVSAFVAMLTRPFERNDREIAISALARLGEEHLLALIEKELPEADIDTRFGLVQAAGRNGSTAFLNLLSEREKIERAAKVKSAIQAILEAGQPAADCHEEDGYMAIDGRFITIPPMIDFFDAEAPEPSEADRATFMTFVDAISAERADMLAKQVPGNNDRSRYYQPFSPEDIEATYGLMTQGVPLQPSIKFFLVFAMRDRKDSRAWYEAMLDRMPLAIALRSLRNSDGDISNCTIKSSYVDRRTQFAVDRLRNWIETGELGLREILTPNQVRPEMPVQSDAQKHFDRSSHLRTLLAEPVRRYERSRDPMALLKEYPAEAVWPWVAENLAPVDEALGLQPAANPLRLEHAMAALALLPAVPQRYLAKLLDIAVTEKRPLRRQAMTLLRNAQGLEARIEALLDDARQPVRINAATWLADIRSDSSKGALRKRLNKEKSDPVRTALIEALQRLGADLSDVIGPATLIADAEKAAQKSAPALPEWLTAFNLPAMRFRDGSGVPANVLNHWLALAIRLKDPGATGQFGLYLDQLDPDDARMLSAWVLESWISFDTHTSSLEEATAYALANYQQHFSWMCRSNKTPELREQVIAQMIREETGGLLNSGSDTKGMLALACRADPVFAANRVRWFLKNHGRRSHQAMALLDALAGIGAPAALQVVIAASVRLKQKSTQARAAEIAERYAEDRGWSFDELADRTVPTAGFDDEGVLELPCGDDRSLYAARLDAALTIHLFKPDGKPVKGLPAGDDEASKDSRKTLSATKKELKQVVDLQGSRLFEAMCVERSWPVADWRSAFHEHPVMRRLVERLVWQGLDADGTPTGLFRPTQEGDFTNAADEPVTIDAFARVRLAHGALVDTATCTAWIAHLKDYEITPFLTQFDAVRAPLSAEQAETAEITDRIGWVADSLTYRGIAEKRGYERVMRDGGGCNEYAKSFPSHAITATIYHSGSHAQDENNRVALKQLGFAKAGHRGPFRLTDVPPVMLAECWADYHALAAKGAFETDWEKVAPW